MKKIIRVLAIYATLGLMAPFAQVTQLQAQTPTPSPAAAQGQCTDENKGAWYAEFTKFRIPDATKAYEAAKKYMAACPTEVAQVKLLRERLAKADLPTEVRTQTEAELKGLAIPNYLEKWTAQYDKDARKLRLTDLFVNQRKYAEAIPLAKEVLADEPDNLTAHIALGYGGYVLAVTTKNESGNAEAINYAKKAIQAIESGKAPESWLPFKSKDDALGYLYYSVGFLERVSNPTEALSYFIKAAQFDSDIKKNPQTYAFIAAAYENEYAKQSAEYERLYKDKDETPESKLAVENINQIVDRIIDALARAVAVAGTDANAQASKAQWLARLTELYKFRHNKSDAGLNELIASVLSKPLPPVPTPITTLPVTTPATTTTPATGSTSSTGSTLAAVPPATNKTTAPAASSSLTTTAKTTATSTAATNSTKAPVKPKTRNNHRRH
jgi:hypothetical protein